jgi:hypothetical protein
LPGNFFPVAEQKKASVNHYYLSVTFVMSACALGVRSYRVKSLPGGITYNSKADGGTWQTTNRLKAAQLK